MKIKSLLQNITVANLPLGPFHLAVINLDGNAEAITEGTVEIIEGKKQLLDLNKDDHVYPGETEVLLFQQKINE